jgi:hypothetical protein
MPNAQTLGRVFGEGPTHTSSPPYTCELLPAPRWQSELVGARQPLSRLAARYAASSPSLAARLAELAPEFASCRPVMGDGNCFYRGFIFALLEALLEAPHVELHARWGAARRGLRILGGKACSLAAGFLVAGPSQCWKSVFRPTPATRPAPCSAGPPPACHSKPPPSPRPPPCRLLRQVQEAWAALAPSTAPGSEPARGAELLTQLLLRVWYAPGAPAADGAGSAPAAAAPASGPLFVPELEAALARRRDMFDPLIAFARLATSHELRRREAAYAPFLAGCGPGYAGLSLLELCRLHVEPMGQEVEQLQMAALAAAMGVTVGVLDVAGSEAGMVTHPAGAGEPLFYLIHLPGVCVCGGGGVRMQGRTPPPRVARGLGLGTSGRPCEGARQKAARLFALGMQGHLVQLPATPFKRHGRTGWHAPGGPHPRRRPSPPRAGHYEICYRA